MGKLEASIKSEIVRLAKRELHKTFVPLGRDVRLLKSTVSQLRKTVLALERFAAHQQKELKKRKIPLEATPEEVKKSRFSPPLIRSLRKQLGDQSEGTGDSCGGHGWGSASVGEWEV